MVTVNSGNTRRAKDLFRTINNVVTSCTTLRAWLLPLFLEEWPALISSVARSIVNLELIRVNHFRGTGRYTALKHLNCHSTVFADLKYDLLNLGQCRMVKILSEYFVV